MADLSKVGGPERPTDPFSGKEPFKKVDADKFKKYVDESDAEQKKKQKKKQKDAEEVEEEAAKLAAARTQSQERPPGEIKFSKQPLVKEVGKSDEKQKKQQKRAEEVVTERKAEETKPQAAPSKTFETAAEAVTPEGAVAPTPTLTPSPDLPVEEKEEEEPPLTQAAPPPPQPKREVEKKPHTPKEPVMPLGQTSPGPFFLPPAAPVTPGYASMKPEVFQLFERMVMAITVMHDSGVNETTIHLNSANFTVFAGAQVVIREYTTAPKTYNVEFLGNAQNTAIFAETAQDLVAAINGANYNFKINRMESSLLPAERPLFHRKEKPGEKGEKESGGHR